MNNSGERSDNLNSKIIITKKDPFDFVPIISYKAADNHNRFYDELHELHKKAIDSQNESLQKSIEIELFNHDVFFLCLSKPTEKKSAEDLNQELKSAIERCFNSFENFRTFFLS